MNDADKLYRFRYLRYYKMNYGGCGNSYDVVDWYLNPFYLPSGMSEEEGFLVLSYLTEYVEKTSGLKPCSLEAIRAVDEVLNIPRFGFKRPKDHSLDGVIDIYTVIGDDKPFESSPHYEKYFEWFTPGVTKDDVKKIYQSHGMTFTNPVPQFSNDGTEHSHQLVKKIRQIFGKGFDK